MNSKKVSAQESQEMMDSLRPHLGRLQKNSLIVGVIGMVVLIIGLVMGVMAGGGNLTTGHTVGHTLLDQWFQSYIFSTLFWLGLSTGSLAILMLYFVVGGGSFHILRRPLEAATRVLPLVLLFAIPVFIGMPAIYSWMHPGYMTSHPVVGDKAIWLNQPFFVGRSIFYFAVWIGLALVINKLSARQDREDLSEEEIEATCEKLGKISAGGLLAFAFTITFLSFDWLMALDPEWYSTLFGAYIAVGELLGTMAGMTILVYLIAGKTTILERVPAKYYRDIGNFTLAMTLLWAYMAFSQWLIIWTANFGDENIWFLARMRNGWQYMAGSLIFIQFALPFFTLLVGNTIKKRPALLMQVACLIVFMRFVDLFWITEPTFRVNCYVTLNDVAALVGIGGIWLYVFFGQFMRSKYLLPLNDPRFGGDELMANAAEAQSTASEVPGLV